MWGVCRGRAGLLGISGDWPSWRRRRSRSSPSTARPTTTARHCSASASSSARRTTGPWPAAFSSRCASRSSRPSAMRTCGGLRAVSSALLPSSFLAIHNAHVTSSPPLFPHRLCLFGPLFFLSPRSRALALSPQLPELACGDALRRHRRGCARARD